MNRAISLDIPGTRPLSIHTAYLDKVPSALIMQGNTQVLCCASYEDKVPPFLKELKDKRHGWLKAEYSMLPTAGGMQRQQRERNRYNSRNLEIERFIGRALRTVINLKTLGTRTITIDCDVIQADGGTRCASVIGGIIAMSQLFHHLVFEQKMADFPPMKLVSAISVGIRNDQILLDMNYEEDLNADADINIVSDENGKLIEATAFIEGKALDPQTHSEAITMAIDTNLRIISGIKPLMEG